MKKVITSCLVAGIMLAAVNFVSADIIRGIEMDFVTIGNAGNAADTGGTPGCGAVSSNYRIGKYEVTAAQWQTIDTAAGIGDSGLWSGNLPTALISWYDATQFCNYLTSGNKYSGAYNFDQSGNFLGIDRVSSISTYGTTYVIPTEDEWYKAAYFKPNASGYSLYANGTDTAPVASAQSNYGQGGPPFAGPWNVGSGAQEQNGTFDMMGNVVEWNETLFGIINRGCRGGAFPNDVDYLASSKRDNATQDTENGIIGFRVASVPEPTTICLLGLGAIALLRKHKMRRN